MSTKHNVKKYTVRLLLAGIAATTLALPTKASAHVVRGRIAVPSGRVNGRIVKPHPTNGGHRGPLGRISNGHKPVMGRIAKHGKKK